MNDTEQLVKDALGKLAERTPHPGPTLNALRRKRKRHRNVFMIATAGMAAVAVLIFAGVIASDRYAPPNSNEAGAVLMPGNGQSVALKYAPHWLPPGFVENYRSTNDQVSRVWVPANAKGYPFNDGGPTVSISTSPKLPDTTSGWDGVSVRGLKAWVRVAQGQSSGLTAHVVWKAQDVLNVEVRGVEDVRTIAMRVAESVRADPKLAYQPAFKLDSRFADHMWGTKPSDWEAMTNWKNQVSVHVGTAPPKLLGETRQIDVRGRQGLRADNGVAVFDGNVWVWATAEPYSDTVLEAVNKVELVPSPDTSWIGSGLE
ncbi:hypothetical protein UK23_15185 [Lentzea aerocolonigenes]|uniref:Uncharacterized protein n=1 Tax=Lentzea aerocolonigenes TaxID=68170 RepID=A0A0F0H027_LENAE|nr:hypothetical protein [Lentzea aerocolonigenes]KJK49064.1 hypothetical protein UK23_15185 [Lentzea aerocolonigenes]